MESRSDISSPLEQLDQDARDALEFARLGRPDSKIGYSEAAPRLTADQLSHFEHETILFEDTKLSSTAGHALKSNQLLLSTTTHDLIVAAYPTGALITQGWTVSVPTADIRHYVATFGRNSQQEVEAGFFFLQGRFIISHSGAKLSLSAEDGTAIVNFLSDFYDLS